jgi:hypothetical protein
MRRRTAKHRNERTTARDTFEKLGIPWNSQPGVVLDSAHHQTSTPAGSALRSKRDLEILLAWQKKKSPTPAAPRAKR